MNKTKPDELRPEYHREDLGQGVRGKYFESYRKGTNLVLLGRAGLKKIVGRINESR